MTPVSYYVAGERSSPKFAAAFAAGCHGRVTSRLELQPGPVALFGSPLAWPLLRAAKTEGRDWYYADHGYFGRGTYFRVTKNAYQHDGRGRRPADRFQRFGLSIRSWQRHGSHIVVCPNSKVYCALHGFDVDAWVTSVTADLRQVTDREIRVRWKTDEPKRPLATDLLGAWAVVVFSSAAAIHGLIHGVPCVTLAAFAATWRMGRQSVADVERPVYPEDRQAFVAALAYEQWTLEELRRGMAWTRFQGEQDRAA